MRTKLKFATDEEAKNFEVQLSDFFTFIQNKRRPHFAKVLTQVLADNIKLYNRVQELENERQQISKQD